MHFYKKEKGEYRLLKTVDTPAKARKSPGALASFTTVTSYAPNPFLQRWRENQIAKLAREHPDLDADGLGELAFGQCRMPDGTLVSSSEFGTAVHRELENATLWRIDGPSAFDDYHRPEWREYVRPFLRWLDENKIAPEHAELTVGCDARRVAGTIDGIGTDANGGFVIWDFKTRSGANVAKKVYEKDAMQLAVGARIFSERWRLGYSPRVYTVVIDADTGDCHPKLWTKDAQMNAMLRFEILREFVQRWENL